MSYISYETYIKDFQAVKDLGEGNCAMVVLVRKKQTGEQYALKKIKCHAHEVGSVVNEIEVVSAINDVAIPQIFYYYTMFMKEKEQIQFGIVMERCQCSLSQYIAERRVRKPYKFTNQEIWYFMKQMGRVFAKMQNLKILHRDIKPANILVKKEGDGRITYKVCDFGYAVRKNEYSGGTITGTEDYVSPRVMTKFMDKKIMIEGISEKDDAYSLGKTILEMIRLRNSTNEEIKLQFKKLFMSLDENIRTVVMRLLDRNEESRWDFVKMEYEIKKIEEMKSADVIDLLSQDENERRFQQYKMLQQQKREMSRGKHQLHEKEIKIDSIHVEDALKKKELNKQRVNVNNETVYLQNDKQEQTKPQQNRPQYLDFRNYKFPNTIYCMKVIGDYAVMGLDNGFGVISLKKGHENYPVFVFKITQIFGPDQLFNIKSIIVNPFVIVFLLSREEFVHVDPKLFVSEIDKVVDNHQRLIKTKDLKEVRIYNFLEMKKFMKKFYKWHPDMYQMKFDHLKATAVKQQVYCMQLAPKFLGRENAVLMGHVNGDITIFGQPHQLLHHDDDDQAIEDLKVISENKLFYITKIWRQVKVIEFFEKADQNGDNFNISSYDTESEIVNFQIVDNDFLKETDGGEGVHFVELYLYNGKCITLDRKLKPKISHTLFESDGDLVLNRVVETSHNWFITKSKQNPHMVVNIVEEQKKLSQSERTYLITSKGQLQDCCTGRTVFDFDMEEPSSIYIDGEKIIVTSYHGYVRVIYPTIEMPKVVERSNKSIFGYDLNDKENALRRKRPMIAKPKMPSNVERRRMYLDYVKRIQNLDSKKQAIKETEDRYQDDGGVLGLKDGNLEKSCE